MTQIIINNPQGLFEHFSEIAAENGITLAATERHLLSIQRAGRSYVYETWLKPTWATRSGDVPWTAGEVIVTAIEAGHLEVDMLQRAIGDDLTHFFLDLHHRAFEAFKAHESLAL